jgi:pyruvate dehydrogenase E2 component (dihydrolipoamide acetyltransferase)
MSEFRMPSLGADMDFGTVLEWRVRPGDRVRRGDVILLVDTDKAEIEVETWEAGVVERILVEPGRKVPVGTVLATLQRDAQAPGAQPPPAPPSPRPGGAQAPPSVATPPPPATARPLPAPSGPPTGREAARTRATPLARRLAAELGVELARAEATGPGGAVTADDVRRAAGAPLPVPAEPVAEGEVPRTVPSPERVAAMRRRIAAGMERSKREIPHYYLATRIDVSRTLAWLAGENLRRPVTDRLLLAALQLRAVARAAAQVPELNGHWVEGGFRPGAGVHVGVVIALRGGGLLVPTLRDADHLDAGGLMRALREVTGRARRGTLRGSDVSEATLTVTNLGDTGVETVLGVIHPPQVALVGFGRVTERPWAEGGLLGVRPVVTATLSADHRASDGQRGARFLSLVARALQAPEPA